MGAGAPVAPAKDLGTWLARTTVAQEAREAEERRTWEGEDVWAQAKEGKARALTQAAQMEEMRRREAKRIERERQAAKEERRRSGRREKGRS